MNTHTHASASTFTIDSLLAEERALTRSILGVLLSEREALSTGHPEVLGELVPQKNKLFEQLADLTRQRQVALAQLGFTADRVGMETWLGRQANGKRLRGEWLALLADLQNAKETNRVNGRLIDDQMRINRQTLDVLMHASGRTGVYGADGRTHSLNASRRFGSA